MSEFRSLTPAGLPEAFDHERYSEKPVVTVDEQDDRIEIHYIFPGFTVGDNEQQLDDQLHPFKEVGISGAGFVSESGRPLLPSFGRFIQIPPGCDYAVRSKTNKPVTFDDILVTPAQEQAVDQADTPPVFGYDAAAYQQNDRYPAEVVQVGTPQNLDDYKVLPIHVRPLQYIPGKRQLLGYSNITVTITVKLKDIDQEELAEFPLADPPTNREGYGNLVLNPRRRIAERIPVRPPAIPILPQPRGPEFLIIYDDRLQDAADLLADWKNRKGLITETVAIGRQWGQASVFRY